MSPKMKRVHSLVDGYMSAVLPSIEFDYCLTLVSQGPVALCAMDGPQEWEQNGRASAIPGWASRRPRSGRSGPPAFHRRRHCISTCIPLASNLRIVEGIGTKMRDTSPEASEIVDIVRRIDRCYNSRSRLVDRMVCGTKLNTGGPAEDSILGFCAIVVDEKVYSIEVPDMRHRSRISWICQVSTIVPVSTVSCTNT